MTKNIEALKARVDELRKQLDAAISVWHAAVKDAYPIQPGATLISNRREAKMAVVTKLEVDYDTVAIYGRKVLKSGKLHATEQQLYSWDDWKVTTSSTTT